MRTKVTLVLLLLNVVLFYYILRIEGPRENLSNGRNVYGSEIASIDSFSRSDRTGPAIQMEKRGDVWWLTKPYEWPVNNNAIKGIISELQHLRNETKFPVADLAKNGQSLAGYGLAEPALTYTFTSGGKSYTTQVGDTTKIGNRLYLLSPDGNLIHVVGSSLLDSLGLSLDRLRSESIFSIPVFEVRSLSLQTASKVRLRREGARWLFETPILARANKNAVETTINALNALQAQSFLETRESSDPAVTGLSTPDLRITLEGNARRETLLIGRAVPSAGPVLLSNNGTAVRAVLYYAKIEDKPAVFTTALPQSLHDSLRIAQESLRDTRILDFESPQVTAFTLSAPGQSDLSIQRLESAAVPASWQLVHRQAAGQPPLSLPADSALITTLLQKLELFSAKKFLSDAPSAEDLENYGFNRPERELTLQLNRGGGPQGQDPSAITLQIGLKPDERGVAYARVANAPFLYQVDASVLEFLPLDIRHYRQRLLRELPEGARITGLTLVPLDTALPIFARQLGDGETWESAFAGEPVPRQQALTTLVGQLRSLRATRFNTDTFDPSGTELAGVAQPWKFRLELTLALTGGNGASQSTSSSLLLTERINGTTQLAGSAEFGVTFALTQELLDALFALTYAPQHDPGPAPTSPVPTPTPAQ